MNWFEILSGSAHGLFVLVCAGVGVRLLLLARQTRALPEMLIGIAFTTIGLVGFPLMAASGFGQGNVGDVNITLLALGLISLSLCIVSLFSFTWRVFRPNEPVAVMITALAAIGVGVIVVMTLRSVLGSPADMPSVEAAGLWTSSLRLPFGVWYGWTAFESLRCYVLGRRRQALGLSDPVVVNRFLIWGLMGALQSLTNIG